MLIKAIFISILASISAILYRFGGEGGIWYKNTKIRDFGVPIIALMTMLILDAKLNFTLIFSSILLFVSMTTYWKILNPLFDKSKDDCYWFNWLATGFAYSLAYLPYVINSHSYFGFIVRTILLSLLTMFWSETIKNVNWEERGRGFLIIATLIKARKKKGDKPAFVTPFGKIGMIAVGIVFGLGLLFTTLNLLGF